MDSISTACSVIHTVTKRLINDPANPTRFSENHKLARSMTNTVWFSSACPCNCSSRLWGPKRNNLLYTVIRERIKSRKMSSLLFLTQVLKCNLKLGSSTFVAKQRPLRLGLNPWLSQLLLNLDYSCYKTCDRICLKTFFFFF